MKNKKGLAAEELATLILVILVGIALLFLIADMTTFVWKDKTKAMTQAFMRLVLAIEYLDEGENTTEVVPLQKGYEIVMYNEEPTNLLTVQNIEKRIPLYNSHLSCSSVGCLCLVKEIRGNKKEIECENTHKRFKRNYRYLAKPDSLKLQTIRIREKDETVEIEVESTETEMREELNKKAEELKNKLKELESGGLVLIKLQDVFKDKPKPELWITSDRDLFLKASSLDYQAHLNTEKFSKAYIIALSPAPSSTNPYPCQGAKVKNTCIKSVFSLENCKEPSKIYIIKEEGMVFKGGNEKWGESPEICPHEESSKGFAYGINSWKFNAIYLKEVNAEGVKILFILPSDGKFKKEEINNMLSKENVKNILSEEGEEETALLKHIFNYIKDEKNNIFEE